MSTIFKDISTADSLPGHIDTGKRIFGRTVGKTTFRSALEPHDCNESNMQLKSCKNLENMSDRRSKMPAFGRTMGLNNRINQDLRTRAQVNVTTESRTFGLQTRNPSTISTLHQDDDMRLNQVLDNMHHRSNISTTSKTFGLISEDVNGITAHNNGRYTQDLRGNNSCNSSVMPNPFGLHTRTLKLQTGGFSQDNLRINQETSIMNFRSTASRTCLDSENLGDSVTQDNEGFNQRNASVNASVMLKPFGLQSRNLTVNPDLGLRLNQDSTLRSNNISAISKTFGPAVRNTTGFNMQENSRYNDEVIDNGGFRRPTLSRVIRGRSSILSSRLFQNQGTKRYCKDLSNLNGFNVSHISLRDADSQSDSRLALNTRSNWMDNQSMSGSVLSAASMKSQFINVLENLHHSILNIGPHVTAEAVRMEFDRAKQKLENISEMSFAPSVKENGAASVISQSSKYICPPIIEPTGPTCPEEGSFHLKSSKDLLKSLISGKGGYRDKCNLTTHMEEEEEREKLSVISSSRNRKSNEDSVFKKPGPYIKNKKKKRSSRILKIKTPEAVKNLKSAISNKVINLKQWYPIAVGSDLAICGVDEGGVTVRTDAVKKRLSNRKVELINGLSCNLIGSPSAMVSVLPKKIITLLKNGITDRWRVLQKELLNCQTAEEETKKRVSKSPKVRSSPVKKKEKTPVGGTKIKKSATPKVTSTPKKKGKVAELRTRSGRTIKPPSMFWIATGSEEVSSTIERSTPVLPLTEEPSRKKTNTPAEGGTPKKKSKKTTPGSSGKILKNRVKASPKKRGNTNDATPLKSKKESKKSPKLKNLWKLKASPSKTKKGDESLKSSGKERLKVKSPKGKKKKTESEAEAKVHSSTEDSKKENRSRKGQGKRKRDANADVESVQAKKSRLEKKSESVVKSTVQTSDSVLKTGKVKKSVRSPTSKSKRSPAKKKKETTKKKTIKYTEGKTEEKEINEFEEDFELKLDDIEIPEIANVSGNPQLSRSQMRLISMETPPLKYFNTHLNLLRSATPVRSPSWCISQRTESEVKQFQKRREEAFKKKIKVDIKKTVITEKSKNVQNRDVKRVMEWVAEKTVRSPQWNSKVLQYVIPSRKQLEKRMNDEEDEDIETEFF